MANTAHPTDRVDILGLERDAWASWWSHVADVDPAATPDGWSLKDDDGLAAFVVAVNGVEHYEEHLPDEFVMRRRIVRSDRGTTP